MQDEVFFAIQRGGSKARLTERLQSLHIGEIKTRILNRLASTSDMSIQNAEIFEVPLKNPLCYCGFACSTWINEENILYNSSLNGEFQASFKSFSLPSLCKSLVGMNAFVRGRSFQMIGSSSNIQNYRHKFISVSFR
jgi:hypothetical protein